MDIVYVSSAMDSEDFTKLFEDCKNVPGQQAQKYNRLMIEGLAANGIQVKAVTARPITSRNCKNKMLCSCDTNKKNLVYHYSSMINFTGIKVFWQFLTSFYNVWEELKKDDVSVVVDVLNASVAYGAALAAKIRKKNCIGIVTDLPNLMVTGTNKVQTFLVNRVIRECTAYVLLTEAMNSIVNPKKKPHIIIEGLCDANMSLIKKKLEISPKICMYAGLLDARYGVKNMVDAFVAAQVENSELHIYGTGPFIPELMKIIEKNKNVIYKGVAMNSEVVKAELEATLLINPRPTSEEFTKYSFPSKNMEYMASGTPLLTTNLPGMPEEYKDHVFLFDGETTEDMAFRIREILNKSETELFNKGMNAKKFVLQEKNNVTQALKIIELCKER